MSFSTSRSIARNCLSRAGAVQLMPPPTIMASFPLSRYRQLSCVPRKSSPSATFPGSLIHMLIPHSLVRSLTVHWLDRKMYDTTTRRSATSFAPMGALLAEECNTARIKATRRVTFEEKWLSLQREYCSFSRHLILSPTMLTEEEPAAY